MIIFKVVNYRLCITLGMAAWFAACASPKPLTGGQKDITPPQIIEEESTPNKQLNFREKEIVITFDEWVTLKDVYTQLVISPLMPDDPEIAQKGKAIIIKLPDSLREETTYSINFGNAITDLHEGNVLENYSYVFSTGTFLDSIRLQGVVTDAVTLKPAENIWVMLHPVGEDSAVYKSKPAYVAKTGRDGKWSISNIRSDSFHIVAIKDANLNFLYDQESELFGWQDSIVFTDSSQALPDILVFPRERRRQIENVAHPHPGWIKVTLPGSLPKTVPVFDPPIRVLTSEWDIDTLHTWYSPDTNYVGKVILGQDTTLIRASTGANPAGEKMTISVVNSRLHPASAAMIKSQVPIESIDTSRMIVSNDSLGVLDYSLHLDSNSARRFSIAASWQAPLRYHMLFHPGAIRDIWGRTNDTLKLTFVVSQAEQYGVMKVMAENLDSQINYVVLINLNDKPMEVFQIKNTSAATLQSDPMLPGKYTLELIEDLNQNGAWDTGRYDMKRQPERKLIFMPDQLRAGWDLETKISWN